MDYSTLIKVYESLESTSKRLEKTDIIVKLIKETHEDEIKKIIYLLQGRVFPSWGEKELGISSQLTLKIISKATGISVDRVEKQWKKIGDLGLVIQELIKEKKQTTLKKEDLTVNKVFNNLRKLIELEGKGMVDKKISLITELLSSANPIEAKYIIRTVLGDLRIGIAEGVIRDSIAKAFNKEVNEIERTGDLTGDYGEVARLIKEGKDLTKIKMIVGKPIKTMLSIKINSIKEVFEELGKPVQFENKMDGFRCMIHKGKNIKIFTRNMEDVTTQFQEIIPIIEKYVDAKECILDSEFVGYDIKTGKYLPFQSISQRIKRKYDIGKIAKEFPIEINVFDIVYYNGKNLIEKELNERRDLLEKIIKEVPKKIVLTKKLITEDEKEAEDFYKKALKDGLEGVIIKGLNSKYISGRYVQGWYKLKPTLEPLDLVIIGAEYGTGKRGKMLSSFVLACKSGDEFLECGMMGTGIKEKAEGITFEKLTKLLKPFIISEEGRRAIIKPRLVIQVGYEEIQKSPTYSSGYALRFPRLTMLREDKSVEEINDIKDLDRIYKHQKGKK